MFSFIFFKVQEVVSMLEDSADFQEARIYMSITPPDK